MRKIAEHQESKELTEEEAQEIQAKKEYDAKQPQIQVVTMEQMTNLKLDDINAKLDFILQWIQNQIPKEAKKE